MLGTTPLGLGVLGGVGANLAAYAPEEALEGVATATVNGQQVRGVVDLVPGNLADLVCVFTDSTGRPVDPSVVTLLLVGPTGVLTTVTWTPATVGPITWSGPTSGTFSFNLLVTPGGWTIQWVASGSLIAATEEVELNVESLATNLEALAKPSIQVVANFVRARTRDDNGRELGVFTDKTRPTAAEVADYIESALEETRASFPHLDVLLPEDFPLFRRIVALRSAQEVEISYDPDRTGGGAFQALQSLHGQAKGALVDRLTARGRGVRHKMGAVTVNSNVVTTPYVDPFDYFLPAGWY